MVTILPIIGAVRRAKERRAVEAELAACRREREQMAEERQRMQGQSETSTYPPSNDTLSPQTYGCDAPAPATGYYPTAEPSPLGVSQPYATVQPLGTPVQGVPMRELPSPAQGRRGSLTAQHGLVGSPAGMEYCRVCESYHALPRCHQTRREQRTERRELRQVHREERREEKRERREARRARS